MKKLFDMESPLMGFLVKAFDCVCLSVLWILFSLPVITMGASSAALYTTVRRCLELDEGHLLKTFWNAFRGNFKQATLCWLVVLALLALLILDAAVFRSFLTSGDAMGNLYWVILILFCVASTWAAYVCAYCARCDGTVREVLRISGLLMLYHPFKALLVFAPMLGYAVLTLTVPTFSIMLPGAVCWLQCRVIEQVLRQHMRPEDLERESKNAPK